MTQQQTLSSSLLQGPQNGERIASILTALNAEIEAQTEYVSLLNAQQEALKVCDRAGYSVLHDRHEQLLTDAEQRTFHFKSLAGELCGAEKTSLKEEIATWPEQERIEAIDASRKLCEIAGEVRQLSDRNGALIRGEISLIAFQLNFILSSAQKDANYASTGATQTIQSTRLLNSVA